MSRVRIGPGDARQDGWTGCRLPSVSCWPTSPSCSWPGWPWVVWIGDQLERSIVDRTASVTALYVESIIEPSVASLSGGGKLTPEEIETLDGHLASSALSDRVRSLRLWSRDGEVIYSPYSKLIGQRFPVEGHLAEAWAGEVVTEMDDLSGEENEWERQYWDRLLEMYIPVRERGTEDIIAVAEFYLPPKDIDDQVAQARLTAWGLVTLAIVLAGLLLWRVVKRGSDTIQRQEVALSRQVDELTDLLEENAELNERVHSAAERTTTLNERSMRRVSSDLHDGPAQMLSLAMLRLDRLQKRAEHGDSPSAAEIAGGREGAAGGDDRHARCRRGPAIARAGLDDDRGGRRTRRRGP